MIVPMTVQCLTCNAYIYKGTKFNCKKETVEDENYCGLKIYRFYFKCTSCSNQFTLKTDPQNSTYVCERGVKALSDPRREEMKKREAEMEQRKKEAEQDVVKRIEQQSKDAMKEMKEVERLEQLKIMQKKNDSISIDDLLDFHHQKDINTKEEQRKRSYTEMKFMSQSQKSYSSKKSEKKKTFSFL